MYSNVIVVLAVLNGVLRGFKGGKGGPECAMKKPT